MRAAADVESVNLEVLEQVARSCATFREALECTARYTHVLHEAAEVSVVDRGDAVLWRFRVTDDVPQPRFVNDFVVFCAARFGVRCMADRRPPREVHFMHEAPAKRDVYSVFGDALVRFGMPHNGFLLDRSMLERPLPGANRRMRALFERYAREEAAKASSSVRNLVRQEIPRRASRAATFA